MRNNQTECPLAGIDFLVNAENVYRTEQFIVKQEIEVVYDDNCFGILVSRDTYYSRTAERDAIYEEVFDFRDKNMDGKRIHAGMHRRTYVD